MESEPQHAFDLTGVDRARWVLEIDRAHLWHPYSSFAPQPASELRLPLVVEDADGVYLNLSDGEGRNFRVVDAMASWWCAVWGYRHPLLDAAVREQLGRMAHVMFGGLTHAGAALLAQRLIERTGGGLDRVFLADSGSVAVEVAMKMALQYQQGASMPGRRRFMTWRSGYHGDTFHPMSVCDPDSGMHANWASILPEHVFVSSPPAGVDSPVDPSYVEEWARTLERHSDEIAGIIVEPVVQGAGRMNFHNPGYLVELRRLADQHGVMLIFDEIATGFGRTGAFFAKDLAGVEPDIMCVGKALTGGYVTLAAAICTATVADTIAQGPVPLLAHGPTFMANPLAVSAALASLDVFDSTDWRAEVARTEAGLREALAPASDAAGVRDVRTLGAIGVIELDHEVNVAASTATAIEHGVWIRPFRNLIYAMPPYVCTLEEVTRIGAALVAAARTSA